MNIHQKAFLLFLIAISLAFGWILLPFFTPVFWAVVLAVIFAPVYRQILKRMQSRHNLAAVITVLLCLFIVILPVMLLTVSLTQEIVVFYQKIRTGEWDVGAYFQQALTTMPPWMFGVLERFELTDLAALREKISGAATEGSRAIAAYAFQLGQNVFGFLLGLILVLYLLFFFLRDGESIAETIRRVMPLGLEHKQILFGKFGTVIRATVKGSLVVAAVQGALGGIIFWILGIQGALLWGVVMAFLSLLPAIGSGFVWAPVALYFLFSGALLKGTVLIVFGVLVIGLIDNFLRPVLVGRDTEMPDYIVLVSTIGGLTLFGLSGFVLGPAIAAMFMAAWELFDSQESSHKDVLPPS